MLLREFPDLHWLKKQAEDQFANRMTMHGTPLSHAGWPTVILNTQTKYCYRDNIRGPLSLFTNLTGTSMVDTNNKRVVIHPDFFYVTNPDQHYTLHIQHTTGTETLNIHFGEYWADQALATLIKNSSELLDDSSFTAPYQRVELHNKLYQKDAALNQLMDKVKIASSELNEEEVLYEILVLLLKNDRQIKKTSEKLPSIKNSTKQEILRRLILAVDYIHSYYDKDLSLEELAAISCLSKFHFLRLFKTIFNKTPYQFINEVKIQRAKLLLLHTRHDIRYISKSLGFRDASSFSRLFRNQTGIYPTQFRTR